jgi:glutathione synthase/RimK-type ligase-like ATP-grasp enzyme
MTRLKSVCLLSCKRVGGPCEDDRPLIAELERRGVAWASLPWEDVGERDWSAFDAVIVRSTWDYYLKISEFSVFLDRLERGGARVFNPPRLLRWNLDKSYLTELERAGVPCVPTFFIEREDTMPLEERLRRLGWDEAVLKPAISAGAHGTFRFRRGDAARFEGARRARSARSQSLLQPFFPSVIEEGEWSLVFFGGELSHALVKRPAAGDFRVQARHGGALERVEPSAADVERALIALAPAKALCGGAWPLYARVDMLRDSRGLAGEKGALVLGELEVLEPELFFRLEPSAPARFCEALTRALEKGEGG